MLLLLTLGVVNSQTLESGGSLTLNPCGLYNNFQSFDINGNLISLRQYNSACLSCSGNGYCSGGFKPIISSSCDSSNYMESFNVEDSGLNGAVTLSVNGLCVQSIGDVEFSSVQTLSCNPDYGNNRLQAFYYDSSNGYFSSYLNNSLCLTAYYYDTKNCSDSPLNTYDYCNEDLTFEERVNDLVNRMNIWEKIDNLSENNIGVPRLGIPPNKVLECLHGIFSDCGQKTNGNTGATFNRSLWNLIGNVISDEGRALNNQNIGGLYCFSPNVNLFRYPTWGRGQEVPGEDPYLSGQYAIEYINGIQGDFLKNGYLKMSNTLKHFADYDLEGCRYSIPCRTAFNAIVSDEDQTDYYFPAPQAAIQVANAQSIMCSYNGINGIPACGNNLFMNEIARGEWNFTGFVISDSGAIPDEFFVSYVESQTDNGSDDPLVHTKLAIEAGCDADLGDGVYAQYLNNTVESGTTSIDVLNTAVKRWMMRAFMLGQMDDPGPEWKYYGPEYVDTDYARNLALEAAQQGIVLVKNENNLLPLSRDTSVSYGFIGPHFNITQDMLSSYRGGNTLVNSHSPYQIGMKQGLNIKFALGCDVICNSTDGFSEAVSVASSVDIVVLFLGLYPMQWANPDEEFPDALEAEAHDRENLDFPGNQFDLLQQIYNANSNIVLVMFNNAQIDLTWPKVNIDGILYCFYPGELGGDAVISVLFGDISPAGRLPYTLYNSTILKKPITDMSLSGSGGITYRYYDYTPVFPFGWGLSYTNFTYRYFYPNNTNTIKTSKYANYYFDKQYYYGDDNDAYIIEVTNTGKMDSDCIVLGFVDYTNVNATSAKMALFDFERVFVPIGESINVTLYLTGETISIVNSLGQRIIMEGEYNLLLGDYPNNNYIQTPLKIFGQTEIIFDINKYKKN